MNENKPEPKVVCDTCHKWHPVSRVEFFRVRSAEFAECLDCKAKREARKAK